MLEKNVNSRMLVEIICLEDLVPEEHLLRKIEAAVDFSKIYEFVEDLYCEYNGRPSIDPVILFKMVLIQHLYGIPSLRRVASEVRANVCYRWFLGYSLHDETPHFSTLSYNFRKRFNKETVDKVFYWILDEIADAGYLNAEAVFTDGTHIKANANTKKKTKEEVPVAAKRYADELLEEINEDRIAHDKRPLQDEDNSDDDDNTSTKPKKKRDNTSKKKLKGVRKKPRREPKKSPKAQPIPKADYLLRENTKSSLFIKHILPATKTGLYWKQK